MGEQPQSQQGFLNKPSNSTLSLGFSKSCLVELVSSEHSGPLFILDVNMVCVNSLRRVSSFTHCGLGVGRFPVLPVHCGIQPWLIATSRCCSLALL